ncbi:MAG: hypothetical protein NZ853_02400 [Leptospiraceae bacterium]|nr:hypothetical protein [Leptospiraceae bacterium]MDW7975030.1 hypothetical protein [Leptospiraceae bacterium]
MKIKTKKFVIIFLLASYYFVYCKSSEPYWFANEKNLYLVRVVRQQVQFYFHIEPETNTARIQELSKSIEHFMQLLETYPYIKIVPKKYDIIIYKNYKSYKNYRPFDVDSLAHFDRKTKYIHIPLLYTFDKEDPNFQIDVPDYVVFHEIIHSILEDCCSHYPIWLNEGLSLLLQNVRSPFVCGKTQIEMNLNLDRVNQIINQIIFHLPYYPEFWSIYDLYEQTLLSGLYVYFLWNQNRLLKFIEFINSDEVKNSKKNLFILITKGNLEIYENEKKEFLLWLIQLQPRSLLRGC